jgi:hypothetical protein
MATTLIHLHPAAPAKPDLGAACNGCGVCCAWQPCPLGVLISGRRWGACDALQWDDSAQRYHCAMVSDPRALWPHLPAAVSRPVQALSRRWIAAGAGCDCDAEVGLDAPADQPPA